MTGLQRNPESELRPQMDPFVVPIEQYESPASRIQGFKELFSYHLKAPSPMMVLGHAAFKTYLEHGRMTPGLQESIGRVFDEIRTKNPSRGAYIGRAFYVPGIDNPNGPRTAGIYDKDEYVRTVETFYQFVIEHNYNTHQNADIALILHPFLKATDPRLTYGGIPLHENETLPWPGGVVVLHPEPGREHQMKIIATFGADEAVKSYPSDIYLVDPKRGTIYDKTIAIKNETTVPLSGSTYDAHFLIPARFEMEQALTDDQILAVAREAEKVFSQRPLARIEFMVQEDGVYIREIAPWEPEDDMDLLHLKPDEIITAQVIRITHTGDVRKIRGPDAIVYFTPETYRERTTDIFVQVTQIPGIRRLVALCWGEITTGHAVKVLAEAGHSVLFVGEKDYPDGLEVKIFRGKDGKGTVEALDPYYNAIIPLSDVQRLSKGEAGLKMARLAMMAAIGLPTPDGFAISSEAIKRYLREIGVGQFIAMLDKENFQHQEQLTKITSIIQKKILSTPLPKSLEDHIMHALARYGFSSYGIRSTGSEDGAGQSRAGLYQSVMDVPPSKVPVAIRTTIASYFAPASIIDMLKAGQLPSEITVGVGVHEFIPVKPGSLGAVIFTYRNTIVIESTAGSPEGIVSRTACDYLKIIVDRRTNAIEIQPVGQTKQTISEQTILEVVGVVKRIEELFKTYQDIELLIQPNDNIFIVQARPR